MRQKWGQNFLVDTAVADRIVDALDAAEGDSVVEVGPGKGVLTERILARVKGLTVIELDRALAAQLAAKWPALAVVNEDFLEWMLPGWPEGTGKLIGNLPYSDASAILRKALAWNGWSTAVFMVQKEVADRIVAPPDCADYGILTLAVQGKADPELLFDVPPYAFRPHPKVTSSVIRLTRLATPLIRREPEFFRVVKAAFGQRRKTLLNSLSHGLELEKPLVGEALRSIGIDPIRRAETLTLEDFNRISETLTLPAR